MCRFEMRLGEGALAVAYYRVEDGGLIADGRAAGAHGVFGRRYPMIIECMSKGNF